MLQKRLAALLVLVVGVGVGWFVYHSQVSKSVPFRLGLDLSGGTQLVYRAKVEGIPGANVADSMSALRDTIERRVNLFGVSEPIVQTEQASALAGGEQRLIVELPGITDTEKAIQLIGQTPVLEFRMQRQNAAPPASFTPEMTNTYFESAAITGKDLKSAELQFQGGAGQLTQPVVVLHFNAAGAKLFADLTKNSVGRTFGIFLDGQPISVPIIREPILDGTAVISGNFTADSARELARNLNYGALPVPIELISTQTVSGTLGEKAVRDGIMAGAWGIGFVILFMVLWYRVPGFLAALALGVYVVAILALFKLIPVTLTAAGIAAFILSVGMAVDANILIFERIKEERRSGKQMDMAIHDGFARAWLSIRDSNISSLITATILFWFGSSLIKGFALVFGLGVLVSMLTAITISRTLLLSLGIRGKNGFTRFMFGSGFSS